MPELSLNDSPDGILIDPSTLASLLRRVDALERATGGATSDPKVGPRLTPASVATPHVVVSSTSVGTNQWEYVIAPVVGGGTTYAGELKVSTVTYKARNRWEEIGGGKAGYSSTSVSAILPIPAGGPVMAYQSVRSGTPIYLFAERNEPTCSASSPA